MSSPPWSLVPLVISQVDGAVYVFGQRPGQCLVRIEYQHSRKRVYGASCGPRWGHWWINVSTSCLELVFHLAKRATGTAEHCWDFARVVDTDIRPVSSMKRRTRLANTLHDASTGAVTSPAGSCKCDST